MFLVELCRFAVQCSDDECSTRTVFHQTLQARNSAVEGLERLRVKAAQNTCLKSVFSNTVKAFSSS